MNDKKIDKVYGEQNSLQTKSFHEFLSKSLKDNKIKEKQYGCNCGSSLSESDEQMANLRLEELFLRTEREKLETELLRKREKRSILCDKLSQARANISVFLQLEEKGMLGSQVGDGLEENLSILKEIKDMGEDAIQKYEPDHKDLFHITCKDIKCAIEKTNIIDVIRTAKKNGWKISISDNEVALFKNGKRIDGKTLKNLFVTHENEYNQGEPCKSKKTKIRSKK